MNRLILSRRARACLQSSRAPKARVRAALLLMAALAAGLVAPGQTFAQAGSANFQRPYSWFVQTGGVATRVHQEPINIIISGQSDVWFTQTGDVHDILTFVSAAYNWQYVGIVGSSEPNQCISGESAQPQNDSLSEQEDISARPSGCASSGQGTGGEFNNHIRGWFQAGDPAEFDNFGSGAWLVAISEEHGCLPDPVIHCIDFNGYNQGRDDFNKELVNAAKIRGYQLAGDPAVLLGNSGPVKCPEVVVGNGCLELQRFTGYPPGADAQGVAYDGWVLEIRIKLPPSQAGSHNAAKPAPVVDGTHTKSIFAHSLDGPMTETWLSPGYPWSRASHQSSLLSNPAAIVDMDDNIYVFTVGDGHQLYEMHHHAKGAWTGWNIIGCCWASADPVVTMDQSGGLQVFMRGDDGHIYRSVRPRGGNFSGWGDIGNLGGPDAIFPNNPAVAVDAFGSVHVYAVGYDQVLWENILHTDGSRSGWHGLQNSPRVTGVPAAVLDIDSTLRVYTINLDTGSLVEAYVQWFNYGNPYIWDDRGNVGGPGWLKNPTAYVDVNGTVRVYENTGFAGVGIAGSVYETHLDRGGTWSGWVNFGSPPDGGAWNSEVAAVMDPDFYNGDHVMRVYAMSSSGTLFEKHLNPGQTWSGWSNLGLGSLP